MKEQLLETLTGIKASKRTYYSEYRDKTRRLDRAVASIASISAALANTTSGVPALAAAVVQVATEHFEADWAMLVLDGSVRQHWIAQRGSGGLQIIEDGPVPAAFEPAIRQVLDEQRSVMANPVSAPAVFATPMCLSEQVVGALAVASSEIVVLDNHDLLVLQTLGNQAAVAIENALLYEESERLRARATELYEEAYRQQMELAEKNRLLEQAGRRLEVARQHEIVNDERNRIARELHDSVAQHLLSIGMNLEWCRAQLADDSPVHARISVAKELARTAVARIRSTIFELSTIQRDEVGLVGALRELVAEFQHITHLAVGLRIVQKPTPLPAPIEHALYHIAQEALFNAYKHAQAQQITLTLTFKAKAVQLSVTDDGIGIASDVLQPSLLPFTPHQTVQYGVFNMRARARELHGTCEIKHRPQGGTEVLVTIPRGIKH